MEQGIARFLIYFAELLVGTLGVFVLCGFFAGLLSRGFARLNRSGKRIIDLTAAIGTPIHEAGHAVMCLLFGHKITKIKLWDPKAENGVYGYVEHTYSRRQVWARLGNLFIGLGPLFSGLGVTVFLLWLCFPQHWSAYLSSSGALIRTEGIQFGESMRGVLDLLLGIFRSFRTDWLRSLLGLIVILPVSLHITLSGVDIRNSLSALPVYSLLLLILELATFWNAGRGAVLSFLLLADFRLLSLFVVVLAFEAMWVVAALIWNGLRIFISWF